MSNEDEFRKFKYTLDDRDISQSKLAKMIDVPQSTISKWLRKNNITPSIPQIKKIAAVFHMPWYVIAEEFDDSISSNSLGDDLEVSKSEYDSFWKTHLEYLSFFDTRKDLFEIDHLFNEYRNKLMECAKLPLVSFVGKSDSGKTSLIKFLLNEQEIITTYQPDTKSLTYFMHVRFKPEGIENKYFVFKDCVTYSNLIHQSYDLNEHLVEAGGLDTFNRFCRHSEGEIEDDRNFFIVVFLDSPLLNHCSILDSPGFDNITTKRDSKLSSLSIKSADYIFYCSSVNGFMENADLPILANIINRVPFNDNNDNRLEKLRILATFGDTFRRTPKDFESLVKKALNRLSLFLRIKNTEIQIEIFKDKVFKASGINQESNKDWHKLLARDLEKNFSRIEDNYFHYLSVVLQELDERIYDRLHYLDYLLEEASEISNILEEINKKQKHGDDRKYLREEKLKVVNLFHNERRSVLEQIQEGFWGVSSPKNISKIIKQNQLKPKDKDIIISLLLDEVDCLIKELINSSIKKIIDKNMEYCHNLNKYYLGMMIGSSELESKMGFNFQKSFLAALRSIRLDGVYLSYLLEVGQAAGLGAVLGGGVGSILSLSTVGLTGAALATATSALIPSLVFGPIGLVVGLGILGRATKVVFSDWESEVGAKLSESLRGSWGKVNSELSEFYEKSLVQFEEGVDEMLNDFQSWLRYTEVYLQQKEPMKKERKKLEDLKIELKKLKQKHEEF